MIVLRSNDFQRYRPRVVLIEVNDFNPIDIQQSEVIKFLNEQDYMLFSWINPNLMFIRSDSIL
jgi:hypothetical protein